jgi:hypothetical protein
MMSNTLKYSLTAAFCMTWSALSFLWYRHAKQVLLTGDSSGEKLAVLQSGKGDVERKPAERLIWQPLTEGAALLNGDTVRTGPNGEGRVSLLESSTIIALERDSLIVIEKSKGTISLDLLSGGLFIKSESKTAKGIAPTIKAGKTQLSLGGSGAEMTLSMDKGKDATLAVSKGNIDINANGKQVTLQQGDAGAISDQGIKEQKLIQVTAPQPNAVLDIGATGSEPVLFTWSPIQENLKIYLEAGPTRSELRRVTSQGIASSSGVLATVLPAGTFYWRLVALDAASGKPGLASLVYLASTISLSPPALILPKKGDQFYLTRGAIDVSASWTKPQSSESSMLLVSKDRDFKEIYLKKSFHEESQTTLEFEDPGVYYWRVLAFFNGRAKPLSSEVAEISIKEKLDLIPPKPVQPENRMVIPLAKVKATGVFLDWSDVPGIENYQVDVKSPSRGAVASETTSVARFQVTDMKVGTYTWKVKSLGPAKQSSEWSEAFTFQVVALGSIAWKEPIADEYQYATKEPSISISWEKSPENAKKWRIRYARDRAELADKGWNSLLGTKATVKLPTAGAYLFEVQALDEADIVLAASKMREINVKAPPTLAAPEFVDFGSKFMKSNSDGSIKIRWKAVKDASGYILVLKEPDTKAAKKFEQNSTSLQLTGLNPGQYKIQISTVNNHGEQGELGEVNYIEVPKTSDIAAPKVKSIKVH